jgi:hypothetical protein
MGGNLSATEFRARHQGPWAANFKERLLRWEDKGFTGSLSDGGLFQILYFLLASCCTHAKQINDRRAASGKSRCCNVEFAVLLPDGVTFSLTLQQFQTVAMPWLMQLMRRQSWCEDATRLLYAHEAEVSVERRNQFAEPPPSYSLESCVLIYTAFQHKDTQWDNSLFLKVCSGRRSIDMAEQERQVKCLIAAFRGSEGRALQEVLVKIPPSTIFVKAVNSNGKPTATEAARLLGVFQGKPPFTAPLLANSIRMIRTRARRYDASHMSTRYRDNPLTDIPGPFVPGKGQSYFRVEFLANTKAQNYVLSRLRLLFNNMPAHAKSRKNADGTPGRCLATLEEMVNKAATQKLICPTTKVPIFNEARSRADSNKHRFRRGRAPRDTLSLP